MIKLRALKESDAPLMLEWMHDEDIQKGFKKDMKGRTLEDALLFCKQAKNQSDTFDSGSIHFAISGDNEEYLGTVSLKEIDMANKSAEFAIVLRKKAQGYGIAFDATNQLLYIAFCRYGLHRVYLNVLADNYNAIKLYEKVGFIFEGEFRDHLYLRGKYVNWKWYSMLEEEYKKRNI